MHSMRARGLALLCASLAALSCGTAVAQVKPEVDTVLKPYAGNVKNNISGALRVGTSETSRRVIDLWAEGFGYYHKGMKIDVETIRDIDAVTAAKRGPLPIPEGADLICLSYPMDPAELREIRESRGVEPIQLPVALDAIVLVVHHKNPLPGLTLDQIAHIFGTGRDIDAWKEVGMNGKFGEMHINRYGRDNTSGTFAAFRAMGLKGGEQRPDVHAQPGSMSVVIEVGTDEGGIGYAATGYAARSKRVRIVPLARKDGEKFIMPNNQTVLSGEYPLRREIYMYVMPQTDGKFSPAAREFMRYALSRDGQQAVLQEGFTPLPAAITEQALLKMESYAMAGGGLYRAER